MKSPLLHLIVWLIIATLTFAGYGLWYAAVAKRSVAVADVQSKIDTKTDTASRINAARAVLSEIENDEFTVQSYFVPETGVVSFISDLEARARAQTAVMKVLSVSTGSVKKQPTLTLSLAIDGTFDAVMRTVGAVEYAPYNLSVSEFSLGKTGKDVWHASLGITVGLVPASTATTTP